MANVRVHNCFSDKIASNVRNEKIKKCFQWKKLNLKKKSKRKKGNYAEANNKIQCSEDGGDVFVVILTSSGWAGTSWRLTWYLTLLGYFRANITRSKLILYGSSAQWYTKTCLQRIVLSPIIIGVEKFFKPLQKFEIILETAFYQFIHGNNLGEMCFLIRISLNITI